MTNDQLQLAAHQIGMYKANIDTPQGIADWRAHNRAAAELRERIGAIFDPYPYPNKALVRALYASLAEHLISRAEFACCMQNVIGRHRL